MTFYSALFDIRRIAIGKQENAGVSTLMKEIFDEEEKENEGFDDNQDIDFEREEEGSRNNVASALKLHSKLSALFQITYYKVTHGKQKTPLQIMVGNSIYGKTRSKTIVTHLNTLGVATSYLEIKRHWRLMAQYTLSCQETPIPSHFSADGWTMGALDNENFADQSSISGTNLKNYTAQVLYQDASEAPMKKPSVSSTNLRESTSSLKRTLSCQKLEPASKPSVRPVLPPSFKTKEDFGMEVNESRASEIAEKTEFLITLLRCGIPPEDSGNVLPPWSGIHSLITQSQSPLMRV